MPEMFERSTQTRVICKGSVVGLASEEGTDLAARYDDRSGTYFFHCDSHPFMHGTFVFTR